jgi:alcohol dehydrogenase (cytochrome c)
VVSADTDRHLYFHDASTGDVLFQTRLPASAEGYPITYAVDGRQYVAVPVGGNRSNAIYVFALPVETGGTP